MQDPALTFGLEPRSEAERAYQTLRREILNGEWIPNERLRPQALQQRFALGLTPIREALMRLAVDGLVLGESQRGFRACGVSSEEWHDLMSARRELERSCLRRAIERGGADWEARITDAMEQLARTPLPRSASDRKAAELWEVRHRNFHFALVSACGSSWRLRFWNTLTDHSERYRKLRLLRRKESAAKVRDAVGDHRAIMEAVLSRDSAQAAKLMDAHLATTEQAIAGLLKLAAEHGGMAAK
ncbi:GntR family transcriptional regulator [Pseudorhodoplanes sp.]|uniref:GntR family transcriptional regulator n=1 Tax=Pseudorhodoplanes sp. TaxID=1934341 RepID=UPI002C9BB493|nr:FCD domain-containing protein [Pseudorhodoplanes sp.]HWV54961.1 FCD domain-containing protein [Pseudorhodoplanes sp.]